MAKAAFVLTNLKKIGISLVLSPIVVLSIASPIFAEEPIHSDAKPNCPLRYCSDYKDDKSCIKCIRCSWSPTNKCEPKAR